MKLNNHGMGDYTLELTAYERNALRSVMYQYASLRDTDERTKNILRKMIQALCNPGVDVDVRED